VPISWTGLGPELLVAIDRAAPRAVRSQLEEGLRAAIRSGRLEPGEKLPSSRELARAIGVSRGLVTECYQQLQSEGYLHSEVGSATRVAAAAAALPPVQTPPAAKPLPMAVDFIAGVPDLASFPGSDWLWAQREAFRQAPTHAVGYGDPAGAAELRIVLASYVRRVRAADVDAGQVLVCSGFAQGLSLTLAALTAGGIRHVGFEDPGYDRAVETTAHRAGVTAVPIPVDSRGINVGALASSSAQAVVVSPAHQWPTGVVLAAGRRRDLVAWAAQVDGFVVEDDYDAEFRYDRDPVGSLQGLAPDRVVTIGTVSKSLAPALRLGWVLSPAELTEPITAGKRDADRGTPTLDQARPSPPDAIRPLRPAPATDAYALRRPPPHLDRGVGGTGAAGPSFRSGRRVPRRGAPAGPGQRGTRHRGGSRPWCRAVRHESTPCLRADPAAPAGARVRQSLRPSHPLWHSRRRRSAALVGPGVESPALSHP
jgi:GntR family transcriptional regulator / MocR family aminotransferase